MTDLRPPLHQVNPKIFDLLHQTDTCTISNAIETFNIRMRNEGFIQGVARCQFPSLPPVAGYAITGRIRTSSPPIAKLLYYHRIDWWEYVASFPSPKVIVLEDVDPTVGTGAFFGEIHGRIARALGVAAYVTNGTIRDVPALESTGFQCFASGLSVSHSYAHIVEFGEAVEIGGLKISPGDLVHGDVHGVQIVPPEVLDGLPGAVQCILDREAELIKFCESGEFTLAKLTSLLTRGNRACPPPDRP